MNVQLPEYVARALAAKAQRRLTIYAHPEHGFFVVLDFVDLGEKICGQSDISAVLALEHLEQELANIAEG